MPTEPTVESARDLPEHEAAERHHGSWLRQTWVIANKDLLIESRTGEVVFTSAFFALLVVVMASLSFYLGPETRAQVAAGVIWLSVAFAAVLALGRGWQREREEGAFEALVVAPIAPSALFAGKGLALFLFLGIVELIVVPCAAVLFGIDLTSQGLGLLAIALAATPGVAASATLFGVMTVRTRARDLIIAIVLFPLLAPTLLAAVVATRELLSGVPLGELTDYLKLMAVFDVVFISGGIGLFGTLIEG